MTGTVSTAITEFLNWARGSGLEVVVLILGALLLSRLVKWADVRVDRQVDAGFSRDNALVRSEAIKHRQAVTQVITWVAITVIWAVAVVLCIRPFWHPHRSLIAPAAVVGLLTGLGSSISPATGRARWWISPCPSPQTRRGVLRASEIDEDFARSTRRARYTAGTIGDRSVPNYVDEPGVDADRNTETMAEVEVSIINWRWAGVPFILRSGNSLAR